jgi:histidinol-phosphate aminotransferase
MNASAFSPLANPWIGGLLCYEPGRPIEDVAREMGFDGADAVHKLASNENVLGPSPRALAAMKEAAPRMHLYPDGGAYYLKQGLARRLDVSPEQLCCGNGSNELIELLGHVFLGPEAGIVMSSCAFIIYKLVASMFRADTVMVPMTDFRHDLDAMARAVRPETKLVFVANPNNPTGTMVTPAELDRFMDRVPDHVAVVLDEAYIELLPPAERPDTLRYVREGRRVFLLRTFSKTYGLAGLRIGYAVAPPEGVALLERVRQPFNANAMAQAAALAALDDEAFVEATRATVRGGLASLAAAFDDMGLDYVPSVANFILVKVGKGKAVTEALQRRRVIVRPMDGYGLPAYVRITVGTEAQNRDLLVALREVLRETGGPGD